MSSEHPRHRISPRGMLVYGLMLASLYGIAWIGGLSHHMGFISGTSADMQALSTQSILLGITYLLLYLIWALLVPILGIGAILFTFLLWLIAPPSTQVP